MIKQIIVMRKDLNMRKGKMCAQAAHASMAVLVNRGRITDNDDFLNIQLTPELSEWLIGSFTKICVSVDSEQELESVYQKAQEAGLLCAMITDNGATEFGGIKTKTCCAIGPAEATDLEPITGHLKLL